MPTLINDLALNMQDVLARLQKPKAVKTTVPVPTVPKKTGVLTAKEAKDIYGWNLPNPDYLLKATPDAKVPGGIRFVAVAPTKWQFDINDKLYTDPAGKVYTEPQFNQYQADAEKTWYKQAQTNADLNAQYKMQNDALLASIDKVFPGSTYEDLFQHLNIEEGQPNRVLRPDILQMFQQKADNPDVIDLVKRLYDEQSPDILDELLKGKQFHDIYGKVFPQQDIDQLLDYANKQPEEFLNKVRAIGRTPDTELLIQKTFQDINDEQLTQIFGVTNTQINRAMMSFDQRLYEQEYEYVAPSDTANYLNKIRIDGRTPENENILKQSWPDITEKQIATIFDSTDQQINEMFPRERDITMPKPSTEAKFIQMGKDELPEEYLLRVNQANTNLQNAMDLQYKSAPVEQMPEITYDEILANPVDDKGNPRVTLAQLGDAYVKQAKMPGAPPAAIIDLKQMAKDMFSPETLGKLSESDMRLNEYNNAVSDIGDAYINLYGSKNLLRSGSASLINAITPFISAGTTLFLGVPLDLTILTKKLEPSQPEITTGDILATISSTIFGLSAIPMPGVNGAIAKTVMTAIGASGYTAKTVLDWNKMSNANRAISVAFDVLMWSGFARQVTGTREYIYENRKFTIRLENEAQNALDVYTRDFGQEVNGYIDAALKDLATGIQTKNTELISKAGWELSYAGKLVPPNEGGIALNNMGVLLTKYPGVPLNPDVFGISQNEQSAYSEILKFYGNPAIKPTGKDLVPYISDLEASLGKQFSATANIVTEAQSSVMANMPKATKTLYDSELTAITSQGVEPLTAQNIAMQRALASTEGQNYLTTFTNKLKNVLQTFNANQIGGIGQPENTAITIGKYTVRPSYTWKVTKPDGTIQTFSSEIDAKKLAMTHPDYRAEPTGNWVAGRMIDGAFNGTQFVTREEAIAQANKWSGNEPTATKPIAEKPIPTKKVKQLPSVNSISDFDVSKDKVVREGNRTFVVDTSGIRAKVEVQSDVITPEVIANINKLTPEQKLKMIQEVRNTYQLSPEGKKERLAELSKGQAQFTVVNQIGAIGQPSGIPIDKVIAWQQKQVNAETNPVNKTFENQALKDLKTAKKQGKTTVPTDYFKNGVPSELIEQGAIGGVPEKQTITVSARLNKKFGGTTEDIEIPVSALANIKAEELGYTFVSKIPNLSKELKTKYNQIYVPNIEERNRLLTQPSPSVPTKEPISKFAQLHGKEAWQMTLTEWTDLTPIKANAQYTHKIEIQKALSESKPVPASVLAEYPELAKQVPTTAQTPAIPATETVYHGGAGIDALNTKFTILSTTEKQKLPSSHVGLTGLSMTTNKNVALEYSKNIGGTEEIFEAQINPKAKIYNIDTKGAGIDEVLTDDQINKLKSQGYDAIRDTSKDAEQEFRALTKNAVITQTSVPAISPGTSIAPDMFGKPAPVKMTDLGESAVSTPLIDVNAEKAKLANKPLPGQIGFEGQVVGESETITSKVESQADIIDTEQRLIESQQKLETLKQDMADDGAKDLIGLVRRTKEGQYEIPNMTLAQFKKYMPRAPLLDSTLTSDKKHVKWEFAFDTLATERGYENGEKLIEGIKNYAKNVDKVLELEQHIKYLEASQPSGETAGAGNVPPEKPPTNISPRPPESMPEPIRPKMTSVQVDAKIEEFSSWLLNPETKEISKMWEDLKREEFGKRLAEFIPIAQANVTKGMTEKEAIGSAMSAFAGKYPSLRNPIFDNISVEFTNALWAKIYYSLIDADPGEIPATVTALTNALTGDPIPSKKSGRPTPGSRVFKYYGEQGASALDRLIRVFGNQPKVLETIKKIAEGKKPLRDVIEGQFHEIGREPNPPIPMTDIERAWFDKTIPSQQTLGLEIPSDLESILTYAPTGKLTLISQPSQPKFTEDIAALHEWSAKQLNIPSKTAAEKELELQVFKLELAIEEERRVGYVPPVFKTDAEQALWHESFRQATQGMLGGAKEFKLEVQTALEKLTSKPFTSKTLEDTRTKIRKDYERAKFDLKGRLAKGEISKDIFDIDMASIEESIAYIPYKKLKALSDQLRLKQITKDQYDIEMADLKWTGTPYPTSQSAFEWEPGIAKATQNIMIPRSDMNGLIRSLKYAGLTVVDIGNFLRANMASIDFSGIRTAIKLIMYKPQQLPHAFNVGFRSTFHEDVAQAEWQKHTKGNYRYATYDKLVKPGLDFARTPDMKQGMSLSQVNEEFGSAVGNRPIQRLTRWSPWIKASNRGFTTLINDITFSLYDGYYDEVMLQGKEIGDGTRPKPKSGFYDSDKLIGDWMHFLAVFSGHASLGPVQGSADLISGIAFAPRAFASQVESPAMLISSNPHTRKAAWRSLITFAGFITTIGVGGELLGLWKFDDDPMSGSFGDIIIAGRIHKDLTFGNRQYLVFLARLMNAIGHNFAPQIFSGQAVNAATGAKYDINIEDLVNNLFTSKSSSLVSMIKEFITQENYFHEKVDYKNRDQWLDRLAQFSLQSIYEVTKENWKIGLASIPDILAGLSNSVYGPEDTFSNLGIPNPEYLDAGITKYNETGDYWSNTNKQFKDVDTKTMVEHGANTRQTVVNELISRYNNDLLTLPNESPLKIENLPIYHKMWLDRQAIVASGDKVKLEEFDKSEITKDSYKGNISQSLYSLYVQYMLLDKPHQEEFLKNHPELNQNPREEMLNNDPTLQGQLAVFGKAQLTSQKAYDAAQEFIKKWDIPLNSIPAGVLPPEALAKDYFGYIEQIRQYPSDSLETQIYVAKITDQKLLDLIDRKAITEPIQSLEIKLANRGLQTTYDIITDSATRTDFNKKHPEYQQNLDKIQAYQNNADDKLADAWVERGKVVTSNGASSPEAKLYLVDNPDVFNWALQNNLLTDTGAGWNIPAMRITVQYHVEDSEYTVLKDDKSRQKYLTDNPQYAQDRIRRDGYEADCPEDLIPKWLTYFQLPAGTFREDFRRKNKDFNDWYVSTGRVNPLPPVTVTPKTPAKTTTTKKPVVVPTYKPSKTTKKTPASTQARIDELNRMMQDTLKTLATVR
jgi:hypothetical protein